MSTTKKKVAIYARVSPDEGAKARLGKQLDALVEYVNEMGYETDKALIYTDMASAAGRGIEGRLGFTRLIEDSETGKFKTIIVWTLDRLARSAESQGVVMRAVKKCRLKIIVASTGTYFTYLRTLPLAFALGFILDRQRSRRLARNEHR